MGETIAPQRQTAQQSTTVSHQLGSCIATTAPDRRPSRATRPRRRRTLPERVDGEAVSPSTTASAVPSTAGEAVEERLVGPRSGLRATAPAPPRARVPAGHCDPYTGAGAGDFAGSSRTAGPDRRGLPALRRGRRAGRAATRRRPRSSRPRPRTRGRSRRRSQGCRATPRAARCWQGRSRRSPRRAPACDRRTPLRSCACARRGRSRWPSRRSAPSRPPPPASARRYPPSRPSRRPGRRSP